MQRSAFVVTLAGAMLLAAPCLAVTFQPLAPATPSGASLADPLHQAGKPHEDLQGDYIQYNQAFPGDGDYTPAGVLRAPRAAPLSFGGASGSAIVRPAPLFSPAQPGPPSPVLSTDGFH